VADPKSRFGSLKLKENPSPGESVFDESDQSGPDEYKKPYDGGGEESGSGSMERSALRRDQRIQNAGKAIVAHMYMLVRNVKIHAPDNAVFLKPIEQLREGMNRVIADDRQLNLNAIGTAIYLNNTQLKFDFSALDSVGFLTKEFERRDIGGFSTNRPVTSQEIRDFLYVFSGEYQGAADEDGANGHKLSSLKLKRYAQVKEILDKLQAEPDLESQIDRKKYLMTIYSRSVFFMRKYFEKVAKGDYTLPFAKAARLVQDLVDLCHDQKTHFLGVTTTRSEADYLAYHSVNTCLLAVVFGQELGLDKKQLHELGMSSMFSQVGLVDLPSEIMNKRGGLTEEERREVDLFPLRSAKKILISRGIDKSTMMRIVAAYESKVDFAIPRKGSDGEVQLVMPKMGLGTFGKIIAICETYDALTSKRPFREAYGPEIALALMSSEIKYKFDPIFLRVFMKVMAIQPIKILEGASSHLRIG
jgi:HD-GYP domain-containing protein (c-di-GMP phosphodiesterase class II)